MPKIITLLSPREINRRLTQHERSEVVKEEPGKANLVARYDTNSVASNDPIEDRRAEAIVEAASSGSAASPNTVSSTRGNLAFFAVMDGHSGYHTSQYLSQKLIAFVAVELDKVFHEIGDYAKIAQTKAAMPVKLWQSIVGTSGSSAGAGNAGLNGDPEIVKRAISRAFVGLDKEIVNTPIELLKEYELSTTSTSGPGSKSSGSLSTLAHSIFPAPASANGHVSATATQRSAYEVMKPALSGSCALLTYIDSAQKDVYVACTGDSRAIAGWYDARTEKWTIEPLSTDQTGRNPSEVRRCVVKLVRSSGYSVADHHRFSPTECNRNILAPRATPSSCEVASWADWNRRGPLATHGTNGRLTCKSDCAKHLCRKTCPSALRRSSSKRRLTSQLDRKLSGGGCLATKEPSSSNSSSWPRMACGTC